MGDPTIDEPGLQVRYFQKATPFQGRSNSAASEVINLHGVEQRGRFVELL